MRILVFNLNGERYGIAADAVVEIIRAVALKPLPSLPKGVSGIFDLRGKIVPVVDVRRRFGLPTKALHPSDHFIVVSMHDSLVGLHVDQALEITMVSEVSAGGLTDLVVGESHIKGAASVGEGMVVIYDVNAFLSQSESTEIKEIITGESALAG